MKRKEKRYLQIGEQFQEKKDLFIRGNYNALYECYNRPSEAKTNIYYKYLKLIDENSDDVINYGIGSYNSMIITLEAIIKKDDKKYYLYITPSYNYFKELESEAL